jgi:hypothetical protein
MTADTRTPPPPWPLEIACALLLLVLGIAPRLAFVHFLPTLPVSDFRGIIDFALAFRDQSLTVGGYYWDVFNIGPPLALSLVFRVFRDSPETTARLATAVWCGLMPLLPFALWRGVLPLWVRGLAGAGLALWPGQVFFSGVVAQDNWLLPPTVALASLAARALLARKGYPVAAGLLYALAVAMRQEQLLVLFPPLLAAAGFLRREGWKPLRLAACALAVGLPFLALCLQRLEATGRFGLSSGHAGYTILGTVVPGASVNYWSDPVSYVASVEPGLVRDRRRLFSESSRLAMAELRRRPGFHALRTLSAAVKFPIDSDADNLFWSTGAAGSLPPSHQSRGQKFAALAGPWLRRQSTAIVGLFLASLVLGAVRRNPAILVLSTAVFLKIGVHAVLVSQGRFYTPATALEILVIALGIWEASRSPNFKLPAVALAAGTAVAVGLALAGPPLVAHVRALDRDDAQRTYRFLLTVLGHQGALDCVVRRGRLTALGNSEAALEPLRPDPAPGETATAVCTLTGKGEPAPLVLQVQDTYAPGGLPGRMAQRVEVDGAEVLEHDLAAEPWTGWTNVPLGEVGAGTRKRVVVEVTALAPNPGAGWGPAANTWFRLARP